MRNRTVEWCMAKVVRVLTKQPIVKSYLALSSLVLENVRSVDEQKTLDIAVENLVSKRAIKRCKDSAGMTTFTLAA